MKNNNILRIMTLVIAFLLIFTIPYQKNSETQSQTKMELTNNISTLSSDNSVSNEQLYSVYDENNELILERLSVEVGDKIIDKNFNEFEVFYVKDNKAYAKFTTSYQKPTVEKNISQSLSSEYVNKRIGLYMTHNDESYETGDGYSSIYGAGGIHDIAKSLNKELTKCGIQTYLDETLHIPHDSYAYSRSKPTASNLISKNLDAVFDIHRDGASRSTYVKKVNGKDRCKVRIVVGQANPNKEKNLKFAMQLMSVAEKECPWLFLDIYYAKGHYNQALQNTSLLFEMGSHLVEKDLVLETVPFLAKIINTTLYNTTIDENNNLTINPTSSNKNTIATSFNDNESHYVVLGVIILLLLLSITLFIGFKLTKKYNQLTN